MTIITPYFPFRVKSCSLFWIRSLAVCSSFLYICSQCSYLNYIRYILEFLIFYTWSFAFHKKHFLSDTTCDSASDAFSLLVELIISFKNAQPPDKTNIWFAVHFVVLFHTLAMSIQRYKFAYPSHQAWREARFSRSRHSAPSLQLCRV